MRSKIAGTNERPRLSIFRSHRHIHVQLIDDRAGVTIVSARDADVQDGKKSAKKSRVLLGGKIGELIAKRALEKKMRRAVFDRGGYAYHGIVKAVAEGARKGGLQL